MYKNALVLLLWTFCLTAEAKSFTFLAFGDAPYSPDMEPQVERLRDYANQALPAFAVHVGDIGGADSCSDTNDQKILKLFSTFKIPLVYTPGDNEWTDCYQSGRGGHDPIQRLSKIRKLFFSDNRDLGSKTLTFNRQSDKAEYKDFVENLSWQMDDTILTTVHIVGSNNNYPTPVKNGKIAGNSQEFESRMKANIAWIKRSFDELKSSTAKVGIFFFQANLNYKEDPSKNPGFKPLIDLFRDEALKLDKPVLLVQGDEHWWIIDQPITTQLGSYTLPVTNLTRLQVYGAPFVGAIEVKVDTSLKEPFSFRPILF